MLLLGGREKPVRLLSAAGYRDTKRLTSVVITHPHGQGILHGEACALGVTSGMADSSLPPRVAQLSGQDWPVSSPSSPALSKK